MAICRPERDGARENVGSRTGNTKPLVGYWTQSPESVGLSVGEIEDKFPCRDACPFEGSWIRESAGSGVEGTLVWTGNQTPSLENEKVYDRDAGDASPLSDLHRLGKAVGSRVAEVGNGAHYESADEGGDTLVESTDPDPLDLSGDQFHSEGEEVKHEDMEEELPAERKLTGDCVVIVEKGERCQSWETFPAERGSMGAGVPVVGRSVSVSVTDGVDQSITEDAGMSGCRPSKGCSVCGGDNCKGTGSYCWDPGGVSAVNKCY